MNINSKNDISGSLISYFSNKVKLHGGINLAQGIPGYDPPERLISTLSSILDKNYHQYAPGTGNNDLLDSIKSLYPNVNNQTRFFITSGATEAISLIYTYLNKKLNKDLNVLTFSPAYESYIHLPKIFDNKIYTYKISSDEFFEENDFKDFFHKNKIKLIFVASPGNPYGRILSKSKMEFLINLCMENDAYIIIDAVYKDLYYIDSPPYYPTDIINPNIFYVNSFSKKFSITGWRVGYLLMHETHFKGLSYIHDYTGLSSPAPLQQAIAIFLNTPEAKNYTDDLRTKIFKNLESASDKLNSNNYYCNKIEGGYFIWAKLPDGIQDSLQFSLSLYEKTRTAVIPGIHFGDEWKNFIRVNIAREENELLKGVDSLINYISHSIY